MMPKFIMLEVDHSPSEDSFKIKLMDKKHMCELDSIEIRYSTETYVSRDLLIGSINGYKAFLRANNVY